MVNTHNSAYFPGNLSGLVAGNGDPVTLGPGIGLSSGMLTISASIILGQVTNLVVSRSTNTSITVSWSPPASSPAPTGYLVMFGVSGSPVTQIILDASQNTFTMASLLAATSYIVSVQAISSSISLVAVTDALPAAVTGSDFNSDFDSDFGGPAATNSDYSNDYSSDFGLMTPPSS